MIANIVLENFKCFRQLEINPKLLTVLIGPNGTGKSSVLQALLLLKQWWAGDRLRIKYQGELINLNGRSDIFRISWMAIHQLELDFRAINTAKILDVTIGRIFPGMLLHPLDSPMTIR